MKNNKEQSPLFRLRKRLNNISLHELSKELNVSYATLYNIEQGNYKIIPRKFLENLKKTGYFFINIFEHEYYRFIDNQELFKSVNWRKVEAI